MPIRWSVWEWRLDIKRTKRWQVWSLVWGCLRVWRRVVLRQMLTRDLKLWTRCGGLCNVRCQHVHAGDAVLIRSAAVAGCSVVAGHCWKWVWNLSKAVRKRFWILLLIICLSLNVVPLIITLCEHWLSALFFPSIFCQVFLSFIFWDCVRECVCEQYRLSVYISILRYILVIYRFA